MEGRGSMLEVWAEAGCKATVWTIMWTCVVLAAAVFEFDFSSVSDKNDSTILFNMLGASFSYIGSIGAEAVIRYSDEKKWPYVFKRGTDDNMCFTGLQLLGCLVVMLLFILLVGVTEHSSLFPFRFSSLQGEPISVLLSDKKFVTILLLGMLFRTYIYAKINKTYRSVTPEEG